MKLFNKFITTIRLLLLLQITENSSESNPDVRTLQDCLNSENEPPNLAQEDFNEMTRSCFTPWTKQLEDLTGLIQGLFSAIDYLPKGSNEL